MILHLNGSQHGGGGLGSKLRHGPEHRLTFFRQRSNAGADDLTCRMSRSGSLGEGLNVPPNFFASSFLSQSPFCSDPMIDVCAVPPPITSSRHAIFSRACVPHIDFFLLKGTPHDSSLSPRLFFLTGASGPFLGAFTKPRPLSRVLTIHLR